MPRIGCDHFHPRQERPPRPLKHAVESVSLMQQEPCQIAAQIVPFGGDSDRIEIMRAEAGRGQACVDELDQIR